MKMVNPVPKNEKYNFYILEKISDTKMSSIYLKYKFVGIKNFSKNVIFVE